MSQTARDFITLAFKEAGVLGVGQSLLSEDINDGMTLLRRMLSVWQKNRWLVPNLYDLSVIGNSQKSNKIGPGQYWNAPRPDKIQAAYIVQRNTGSTPVSLPCKLIFSYEDYARLTVKNLQSLPYAVFYDAAYPYGNVYFWPIPSSIYELHLILKGSINWQMQISAGRIYTAGNEYTNGVYLAVPFETGDENQNGATANVTVAGGIVTTVEIVNGGQGYVINNLLTIDAANIGGTGDDFTYLVTNTTISLDSEFEAPEEYEEAIHYNLAMRLCSAYQTDATDTTKRLAKASLNTIRAANIQIPTMSMPAGIRKGGAGWNIYNPDGYGVG